MLRYDEEALVDALNKLRPDGRVAFAAACAERLLPIIRTVHEKTGQGDFAVVEEQLKRLWRHLDGTLRLSATESQRLARRLEILIPGEDAPWSEHNPYVENAISAVCYALQCHATDQPQTAAYAARQAYEAVDHFVHNRDNVDFNLPGSEDRVLQDPLVQSELQRQRDDLDALARMSESIDIIHQLRTRAETQAFQIRMS
jgi:uncharacterized protein YjaG (DUF416 family)